MRLGIVTPDEVRNCATLVSSSQRTSLRREIAGMIDEAEEMHSVYPDANSANLERAIVLLQRADSAMASASWQASTSRYCSATDVNALVDEAALLVTAFDEMYGLGSAGGVYDDDEIPDYGPPYNPDGSGTGTGTGTGTKPTTGGGDDGERPPLVVPPSSLMTWLGVGLLGGAAVLGVVYFSKKGKRR